MAPLPQRLRLALVLLGLACATLASFALWHARPRVEPMEGGEQTLASESRPTPSSSPNPASAAASVLREPAPSASRAESKRSIRGRVVDLAGSPLPGLAVELFAPSVNAAGARPLRTVKTDETGAFAFRDEDPRLGEAFRLAVRRVEGYADFESEVVTWEREDLVLHLRAEAVLEVITVDEESGAVVDPCDVAVAPVLPWNREEASPAKPRAGKQTFGSNRRCAMVGRPRPGSVLLAPAEPGEALFLIVPRDQAHARFVVRRIVSEAPFQPLTVRVPRQRSRDLRILGPDQRPLANATFQLVRSEVPPWLPSVPPIVDVEFRGAGHVHRVRVQGGVTDSAGASFLMGARGVLYELVVDAPGVARETFRDVTVDDALPPLTLAFAPGAELHGKIGPARALQRMAWEDPRKEGVKIHPPTAWLDPRSTGASSLAGFPLERDGSFRFTGLKPGSYVLRMYWYGPGGAPSQEELAKIEDLRPGERREVNPQVEHLVPATLRGLVLWNGEPLRNHAFDLRGSVNVPGVGQRLLAPVPTKTDGEGRFVAEVGSGAWRIEAPLGAKGPMPHFWPRSATPALEVNGGIDAEGTFDLRATAVTLNLFDARGEAVVGRTLYIVHEGGGGAFQILTDALGRARFECVGLGAFHVDAALDHPRSVRIGKLVLDGRRAAIALDLRLPE